MASQDLELGDKVWVYSRTAGGYILAVVAESEYEGLITVNYDLEEQQLRKHCQLQDLCKDKCTTNQLYYQILKTLHKGATMDYDALRASRIEAAVKHWCEKANRQSEPAAVFITGSVCAGKSSFIKKLSRQGSLDGFVHVNDDDILCWILDGLRNYNALRTVMYTNDKYERWEDMDWSTDQGEVRKRVQVIAMKEMANFITDSITIPSSVPYAFADAGYRVHVFESH